MSARVSTAIKGPTCLLIVAVGIGVFGLALRKTESGVNVLTSATSVGEMRADFDQYRCLENKFDRLIPAGAAVFDANPDRLDSQRVFEFASARDIVVAKPSPQSWTVKSASGTACGHVDLIVVPPTARRAP